MPIRTFAIFLMFVIMSYVNSIANDVTTVVNKGCFEIGGYFAKGFLFVDDYPHSYYGFYEIAPSFNYYPLSHVFIAPTLSFLFISEMKQIGVGGRIGFINSIAESSFHYFIGTAFHNDILYYTIERTVTDNNTGKLSANSFGNTVQFYLGIKIPLRNKLFFNIEPSYSIRTFNKISLPTLSFSFGLSGLIHGGR